MTAVELADALTSLPDTTDTHSDRLKVADIAVTNDGQGTNQIALSGPDGGVFDVGGFLRCWHGTRCVANTKSSDSVTISVADPSQPGSTPVTVDSSPSFFNEAGPFDGGSYKQGPVASTITGSTGDGGDVRIPSSIDGKPVIVTGPNAFERNVGLNAVVIPASVKRIGFAAFG